MIPRKFLMVIVPVLISISIENLPAQDVGFSNVDDIGNVALLREQANIMGQWLDWRMKNLLPSMMQKHDIDMWLIIDRENNKDPVAVTLGDRMFGGNFTIINNRDGNAGIERMRGSFGRIAQIVKDLDPNTIGINTSDLWNNGDGLTKALHDQLLKALENYTDRLVSAENLSNEWLETKIPQELDVYRHVCGVTHDIISEAFSNKVIIPGVTTTTDVEWYISQRIAELGLKGWAFSIVIQRSPENLAKFDDNPGLFSIEMPSSSFAREVVIQRGDLLHSDIGLEYFGLNTDNQHHAYILRKGETDVPEGIKQALRNSNRLQDIFMSEFKEGRTGNEITRATLKRAQEEGLRAMIYTHPIGYHQHSGGTVLGADNEYAQINPIPKGEYPLHYNTAYSIELETLTIIPEWDGKDIEIALEEQGVFTQEGAYFLDGRQTKFFLIK